ncbi:hypothetical protein CR513_52417, partial [Mucuna pruriens]
MTIKTKRKGEANIFGHMSKDPKKRRIEQRGALRTHVQRTEAVQRSNAISAYSFLFGRMSKGKLRVPGKTTPLNATTQDFIKKNPHQLILGLMEAYKMGNSSSFQGFEFWLWEGNSKKKMRSEREGANEWLLFPLYHYVTLNEGADDWLPFPHLLLTLSFSFSFEEHGQSTVHCLVLYFRTRGPIGIYAFLPNLWTQEPKMQAPKVGFLPSTLHRVQPRSNLPRTRVVASNQFWFLVMNAIPNQPKFLRRPPNIRPLPTEGLHNRDLELAGITHVQSAATQTLNLHPLDRLDAILKYRGSPINGRDSVYTKNGEVEVVVEKQSQ